MKFSRTIYAFAGKTANDFIRCSTFSPTPISLKTFIAFGRTANQISSFNFLRKELPVRLANIMQEILLLPDRMHETSHVKLVVALYEKSFSELIEYENQTSDLKTLTSYTDCIANIRERHVNVVETMAQGVLQVKEIHGVDPSTDNQLQYFLDRFYLNRIGIRMLINQHVSIFGARLNESHGYVGIIDPATNILAIVQDAYDKACDICQHYYGTAPDIRVVIIDRKSDEKGNRKDLYSRWDCLTRDSLNMCIANKVIDMSYVPIHLFHMLFELMKNAMRAAVEHHANSDAVPPIKVLVCGASENVTIKIFDNGGGIPRSLMDQVFKYTFTTADQSASYNVGLSNAVPMAGYGYGLPLSRLYARYFNGDLSLSSIEGFGTDAFIYLRRRPSEADELLPIFNKTSARQYVHSGIPAADWSNPNYTSGLYTV